MWDFSIGKTVNGLMRTLPFIVFRVLVYFGIALLYIFSTGIGSAVGFGFGSFGDGGGRGAGAFYGGLFGFAGASGLLYFLREYILYMVKAGHIAVLVYAYDDKELPDGRGQIDFAANVVKENFGQANILFALDQLVKGVLKVITGIVGGITAFLPIPAVQNVVGVINTILKTSLTYVDEIILAHNLRIQSDNPWETSRQALVLYAQNYRSFLKNAVWLWLIMWIITLVIFLIFIGPALGILAIFPGNAGFWGFAIAFIMAWAFKAAIIEPFAIYALMQVYFKKIEGQVPNPEWDEKLAKASKKFRELKDKAMSHVPGSHKAPDPQPAPAGDGPLPPPPDPE